MITKINFLLQGFGFNDITDFRLSAFGFLLTKKVLSWSLLIGLVESFFAKYFGLPLIVFSAFVILNILEYLSGIRAAKKAGICIESRKMGRMFLKVGVYLLIIFVLQSFKRGLNFPEILGYELNPFTVMYWAFLSGIIYQLIKSLLENLEKLGYKEARGILGEITRKFGSKEEHIE